MSNPTEDLEASRLAALQAQLDKLGEAENIELDDVIPEDPPAEEVKPEASASPDAGAEEKQKDAGVVEQPADEKDKPKLVPLKALHEERQAKHLFKLQAEAKDREIAELKAKLEAVQNGEVDADPASIDTELLATLEGEGPEFAKLAKQVKALASKVQAQPAPATPKVEDAAAIAAEAEEAIEQLPWLKDVIAKGGALAQEAFNIDRTLPEQYDSLKDRYVAVLKELADRNGLPHEVVLRGVETPKAEVATEKVAEAPKAKTVESEPNTLSDLAAASSGDDQVARYMAMNVQARQAYLLNMSEGERMAFVERMALG